MPQSTKNNNNGKTSPCKALLPCYHLTWHLFPSPLAVLEDVGVLLRHVEQVKAGNARVPESESEK